MAEQSAQARPFDNRIDGAIGNGAVNDVAINGMTATTKTILAFAREIEQMSRQALDRTARHIEKLRKAHSMEEAASIQTDFVKESLEHTLQHTKKFIEMLADFPLDMARPYQDDWLQSVNTAVQTTEAAGHAAAASVERLSGVARRN